MSARIPNILSIAGTDPTGGAGIQADLKTFGALGTYGMAVVTAIVAQNTRAVTQVAAQPPALVAAQLDAVFDDVRVDAVKIGMVADADIATVIVERLARHRPPFVVFDPVMAASTKGALMNESQLDDIRRLLLPRVTLLTPNLREAGRLLGQPAPVDEAGMRACLPALHALGVKNVLLKGGHLDGGEAVDLLSTPDGVVRLASPRIETRHGHGTGCTLSSAIAALWARLAQTAEPTGGPIPMDGATVSDGAAAVKGTTAGSYTTAGSTTTGNDTAANIDTVHLEMAVRQARAYLTGALVNADTLQVGHGSGPLHHFWS